MNEFHVIAEDDEQGRMEVAFPRQLALKIQRGFHLNIL